MTSCEQSDGKKAAAVANKHSRENDSDFSVEEIHTVKHVAGGGKQEHDRVTKAKRRSQI